MNIGDVLMRMLEDLQQAMDEDDGPQIPTEGTEDAAAMVGEERKLERQAAEASGIERCEIGVYQPHYMGTLRFHGDSGHLHGLLWAEQSPGEWAAFPFAGQIKPGDPRAVMARLHELGTPYHNPAEVGIPQFPKGRAGAAADDSGGSEG